VEIAIRAQRDDVAAIESLYDWLRADPDLGASVGQSRMAPRRGEMGGVMDAVIVAVGSGGAVTALGPLAQELASCGRDTRTSSWRSKPVPMGRGPSPSMPTGVRKEDIDDIIATLRDVE
jgi:hypothetical protein